ncbi:hypothetical protein ABID42_004714 [Arcicella rosea]
MQGILKHLNFRKWQPLMDELIFEKWLVEQGMEHENERYLLAILCEKLHRAKILRPSISTLETLVAGIREQLEVETYQRLSNLLKEDFSKKLDNLLDVDASRRITKHRWLCTMPNSNTAKEINFMFEKVDFLIDMGVKTWDFASLSDNRRKRLAHTVRTTNNTDLKRFKKIRLYPMLICFLAESFLDISDLILVMYADYWQKMSNKAKKALDICLLEDVKSQQKAIKIVTQTSQIVVDESIDDPHLRPKIYEKVPKMQIQDALQMLTEKQQKTYSHLAFLRYSYPTMKQFTPNLLAKFDFKVAFTKDNFDSALTLVKDLQTGKKRKIPQDTPMNFVSANWQKIVLQGGIVHQQNYELCVLSLLKDRLQSGDVYIDLSRKFANLESLLLEKNYWKIHQERICQELNLPNLTIKIDEKVKELADLLPKLSEKLTQANDIRIENDLLEVSPLSADDISPLAKMLQEQINTRLPKVSLVEMIQEVDSWINYSKELENAYSARNPQHQNLKYAALFANACNLSLADLAASAVRSFF